MSVIYSLLSLGAQLAPVAATAKLGDLPDGVVHFPLKRTLQSETLGLYKRDAGYVEVVLNNTIASYTADLLIGSNQQLVNVAIDTGSSDLWVMNASNPYCVGAANSNVSAADQFNCTEYVFNTATSTSFVSNETAFTIQYGDYTFANGTFGTDAVVVGNTTIEGANFAVASVSNSSQPVFGIGLVSDESTVVTVIDGELEPTYANLPVQMKQQGIIAHNAYSLWLNDINSAEGNLLFGGVDHAKYSGTLQTVPLVSDIAGIAPYSFLVMLNGVSLYQGANSALISPLSVPALLDSGTTLIYLPTGVYDVIVNSLGGTFAEGYAAVPCDSTGGITIDIAGLDFYVPFQDMLFTLDNSTTMCMLGVSDGGDSVILGDTFLRSVYVVYDLDNLEVALAPTIFNATDSDIEAITTGIPSAVQAPGYSSTAEVPHYYTVAPTFYQQGGNGSYFGNYPASTPLYASGVSAAASGYVGSIGSNGTVSASASSTLSPQHSTQAPSVNKGAHGSPANGLGVVGAVAGVLMMLI